MIPNNTTFLINKSPSYYMCCKCTTKPADYYVLAGQNPKSQTKMIALCDVCYHHQQHHEHNNRRRRNNRI